MRGSPGAAEIIKDTGTARNGAWCREDVENKHNILSRMAFQFPAGKEITYRGLQKSSLQDAEQSREGDRQN